MQSTIFISEPPLTDEDTQEYAPLRNFEIVMTVVESANPYLNKRQVRTAMLATEAIAEAMFQNTVTSYEDMAGGHPFWMLHCRKYKGMFNGERVTLELVAG